jgi:hypothetical protein
LAVVYVAGSAGIPPSRGEIVSSRFFCVDAGESELQSRGPPGRFCVSLADLLNWRLQDYCLGRAELLHQILGRLVDAGTGRPALMPPQDLAAALAAEFTGGQSGSDA